MEPLYDLIIILNFENHRNFYIKGDLVMSWTWLTSEMTIQLVYSGIHIII